MMVETPKVAILFGFGINCDRETAAVFELAGAQSERVHVNHFVNGERDLSEFHILAVPGGFSSVITWVLAVYLVTECGLQ